MPPTPAEFDAGARHIACRNAQGRRTEIFFSFDQFQIALPQSRFGIMLRANWPLTRWAASYPEREEPP
jgi:hypothetical protein